MHTVTASAPPRAGATPLRDTRTTRPAFARACDSRSAMRVLDPEAWCALGVPLLRDPRSLVSRLHDLHAPVAGTAIVAVLDARGRPVASASFAVGGDEDGWGCRNMLLDHLRATTPDGLRRPAPTHTAVLLLCRAGSRDREPADGRWMWALRDACTLHGLRCGAFVALADDGWKVAGEDRCGRSPATGRRARATTPLRGITLAPAAAPNGKSADACAGQAS